MKRSLLWIIIFLVAVFVLSSVIRNGKENTPDEEKEPPAEIPDGILVSEIPKHADILFVSMRYVFNNLTFLDENYEIKKDFLNDPKCIAMIYDAEHDVLASPRQLYSLDIETGETTQLTNVGCDFSSSKPIDSARIMMLFCFTSTTPPLIS